MTTCPILARTVGFLGSVPDVATFLTELGICSVCFLPSRAQRNVWQEQTGQMPSFAKKKVVMTMMMAWADSDTRRGSGLPRSTDHLLLSVLFSV